MEKMKDMMAWRAKDTISADEIEKCCGKCRFGRMVQNLEMKCMRHKIKTETVRMCDDWQGKESA